MKICKKYTVLQQKIEYKKQESDRAVLLICFIHTFYISNSFCDIYRNELKNRYTHVDYQKIKNVPNVPNVPNFDLTQRQTKILELIKIDNRITAKELAEQLEVSEKTIKRDISNLRQKNILSSSGNTNNGIWIIKK